jgi:hypothetical protein
MYTGLPNFKEEKIHVDCNDACGSLLIQQESYDAVSHKGWGSVYVNYMINSFYAKQDNPWYKFKEKIKLLWTILCGKEYTLYEVILMSGKNISDFKQAVSTLHEDVYYESEEFKNQVIK